MLQRHIVSDSQIAELAKGIYEKHKQAIDIIIEHRPDQATEVGRRLEEMIRAESSLVPDHCTKSAIRFFPKEWSDIPSLKQGRGWTPSKRILLFQFDNYPDKLWLSLYIGQSEPAAENVRQFLFDVSQKYPNLFRQPRKLGATLNAIWSVPILTKQDYAAAIASEQKEIYEKLAARWTTFVATELPPIVSAIKQEFGK